MINSKIATYIRLPIYIFFILSLFSVSVAKAMVIPINTSDWTYQKSPSSDKISLNDVWTQLENNTPTKTANSSGSLISDFQLSNDFIFSGHMQATFADNAGCITSNDNSCNDNDLMGIVFGWQDPENHYRFGWGQGGINDITGRNGLFLIEEINGVSNTIAHWSNLYWQEEQTYDFKVERTGDFLNIMLSGIGRTTPGTQGNIPIENTSDLTSIAIDYTVSNSIWLSGNVGVYTESQTAIFSSFFVKDVQEVTTPYVFGLFATVVGLMLIRKLKTQTKY